MGMYHRSYHGKTETVSPVGAAAIQTDEAFKHPGFILIRNSRTVVDHPELHFIF